MYLLEFSVAIGFTCGEGACAAAHIAEGFVHLGCGDSDIANACGIEEGEGVFAGCKVKSPKHVLKLRVVMSAGFVVIGKPAKEDTCLVATSSRHKDVEIVVPLRKQQQKGLIGLMLEAGWLAVRGKNWRISVGPIVTRS